MKKYIREMIDDLRKQHPPKAAKNVKRDLGTCTFDAPPATVVPQDLEDQDLENQELSSDPEQRVRQLDFQAQQAEERETL